MAFRNQVIGLVRFSYPALSGFGKTPQGLTETEAFLYDPARLERRFHLFERLCLPSLLNQSDPDFTVVFLVGTLFPDDWTARLERLIAPLADARIARVRQMDNYPATKEGFGIVDKGAFSHRTTFRLDDDDALSVRYVQRLKDRARHLYRAGRPDRGFAIAFSRGLYLETAAGGNRVFDVTERLPLGLGLSLTLPVERPGNVYLHHHRQIGQDRDLWQECSGVNFIRSVHPDNDAGLNVNGARDRMDRDQIRAVLARDFATDFDALMAI